MRTAMSKDRITSPENPCTVPKDSPAFSGAIRTDHHTADLSGDIEALDIAVWQLDMEYRVVELNKKARKIYGNNAAGNYCYNLADQQNRVCQQCPVKQVYSGSNVASSLHEGVDADGNKIYTHHIAAPIRNEQGILTGVLVFIVEITNHQGVTSHLKGNSKGNSERLAAVVDEKIRALEERESAFRDLYNQSKIHEALMRSLLTTSSEAMVIYDGMGHAKYLSPRFTEMFGWHREDLINHKIPFVPPEEFEDTHANYTSPTEAGPSINHFKTKRLTKDQGILEVDISVTKYIDDRNRPAWVLVTFNRRSTDSAQQAGLHQYETTEAIGRLTCGVARDLSRILKGIQANLTLLISSVKTHHPTYGGHLSAIEAHIQSATDLTQRLLGCTQGERSNTTITNLNELIDSSLEKLSPTRKEIIINKNLDPHLKQADVNPHQIEQVLEALFLNAVQAMPYGGNLFMLSENAVIDLKDINHPHVNPGEYIKISFTDTGIGMNQSTLEKIFEPYFTTQGRDIGAGLGLAAAFGIVQGHGGTITVQSKVGLGTTFKVYLPATIGKPGKESTEVPYFIPGQGTLLLVDDEKMVREVARPMLEKIGYSVLLAANGEEAIDIYERWSQDIQLVIIDIIMPGMNGGEVFDALVQRDPNVKVLLSSGYSVTGEAEEIMDRGAKGFIQKPFGIGALSEKIRSILDD